MKLPPGPWLPIVLAVAVWVIAAIAVWALVAR